MKHTPILHFLLLTAGSFHPIFEPKNSILHSFSEGSLILGLLILNPTKEDEILPTL